MILIADAGSTKTSWSVYDGRETRMFETEGINPAIQKRDEILYRLAEEFPDKDFKSGISKIFFFGAGCAPGEKKQLMNDILSEFFLSAKVQVDSDLLGAAIALCKRDEGIACILGTGANSCHYDGKMILKQVASGGYILGDEGSGSYLGKKLLIDYLRNDLPEYLKNKLEHERHLSDQKIIANVYSANSPNRFLSGFSEFISSNIGDKYCQNLVEQSFRDFFASQLSHYENRENLNINFTGSIAYIFQEQLKKILLENNCTLGLVIRQPIQELANHIIGLEKS